jgi:type VI secretion system FHA domain protein
MRLTLNVLRCPERAAPETRSITGGELSVGRGPGADWVLPDPERLLSKRHLLVAFRGGGWQLADISTNGTFLNRETGPVGRGQVRDLRDGDRLRLGEYEIEVRLAAEDEPKGTDRRADPFAFDDPFTPPRAAPSPARDLGAPPSPSVLLPPDFDPLGPDAAEPILGPTQPDHSPALEDALPRARAGAVLPDDWDRDLRDEAGPERRNPAPAPPRAPVLDPRPPVKPPPADPSHSDDTLLAAFLRGAEMPRTAPANPVAMMEALGTAFRALVSGLRAALIARAAVKGEFRIEQTMLRARGNNPLKFSPGDEEALAALLGGDRRGDMPPADAVADALRDLRLHELASMAAMQSAVRTLLDRLEPGPLRAAAERNGRALLPAQTKARAWDAYEALHAQTVQALADDFDSVFGKAFARAYERAIAEIAAKDAQ